MTSDRPTDQPASGGVSWKPRWWVAFTTVSSYALGIGLVIWETAHQGRLEVFIVALVLMGSGSALAAAELIRGR